MASADHTQQYSLEDLFTPGERDSANHLKSLLGFLQSDVGFAL